MLAILNTTGKYTGIQEKNMGLKYTSPLTAKLTPDTWKDKLNLKDLSLDEVTDLIGDFKEMKKFAGQLEGYLKEAIAAKMPEGETEYKGTHWYVMFNHRVRAGSLDKDLIQQEMGEEWVEAHTKEPTEYVEMRMKPVVEGEDVE